jgi:hypothetical protein
VDGPIYYRNSASKRAVVQSLADADKALRMHPWKKTAAYTKALRTVEEALAGNCTPKSALAAFVAVVEEQAVLLPRPEGRDLKAVDSLIHDFRRIY